jgi:hypothetical protein
MRVQRAKQQDIFVMTSNDEKKHCPRISFSGKKSILRDDYKGKVAMPKGLVKILTHL